MGPNEEGEICVRGPIVMKGYIGNEKATRETVDSEGWLHTGDVGYYDEDGFFFLTDRKKELIKYKGLQVSPTELEKLLLNHPEIQDAGVCSVPDEVAGELPRAYIVRRPGSKLTEKEIAKYIAGRSPVTTIHFLWFFVRFLFIFFCSFISQTKSVPTSDYVEESSSLMSSLKRPLEKLCAVN